MMKPTKISVVVLAVMLACASVSVQAKNAQTPELMVGAAVRDITPTAKMLPLTRKVDVTMVGVLDPIHVRAIALSSGGATTLLVCAETGRSLSPQLAGVLSRHTGLPLEAIVFTSSHSHATPEITEPIDLYFEEGSEPGPQQRWAEMAQAQMLAAADEALAGMKPASVGIGYSESHINANRNVSYNQIDAGGKITQSVGLGYNPTGVSDKTLAAIRFNDRKGNPVAFIINHPVHGVVMHGNTCIDGKTGISADIPGIVSGFLEEKYPGSVAMWLSGAAGDQNPIVMNQMNMRSPMTGEFEEKYSDSYDILMWISKVHFADIETALSGIRTFAGDAKVNFDYRDMGIPATDGGSHTVSLQLVRIGNIALVCFPGEAFVQLGLDVKKNSLLKDTVFVNHAWQRTYQSPGYYADDAGIARGGFGTRAGYKAGFLSPALVTMTNTMISETDAWTFNGDGTATSDITGSRVILGLDGTPGTDDDNRIVNPAGAVLVRDVKPVLDGQGMVYVPLAGGLNVYAGPDHAIGTTDDVVKGFGRYPQSDVTGDTLDPLDWRPLAVDGDRLVMACDKILAGVPFNLDDGDGDDWAGSNLRAWLNSTGGRDITGDTRGFYDAAFNASEKGRIVMTDVPMSSDSRFIAYNKLTEAGGWDYYSTSGTDTKDHVWALSGEEVFRYFGSSTITPQVETRHDPAYYSNAYFPPSDYAHAKGVKVNTGRNGPSYIGYGDFWTRSNGDATDTGTSHGVFLGSMGSLNYGRTVSSVYGALPVVTVRLEK